MLQYVTDYIEEKKSSINDNQDVSILQGLYDDLLILRKTSKNANLKNIQLANARETSQGRQTTYNVDDCYNYTSPPILRRSTTSAYSTPAREQIMRNISEYETEYINPNNIILLHNEEKHEPQNKTKLTRSITGWINDPINSDHHDTEQFTQNIY